MAVMGDTLDPLLLDTQAAFTDQVYPALAHQPWGYGWFQPAWHEPMMNCYGLVLWPHWTTRGTLCCLLLFP